MARGPAAQRLTKGNFLRATDCMYIKTVTTIIENTAFASRDRPCSMLFEPLLQRPGPQVKLEKSGREKILRSQDLTLH